MPRQAFGYVNTTLLLSFIVIYTLCVYMCLMLFELAYLEIKFMLALILRTYSFKLAKEVDEDYVNTIVLPMKHGIEVFVTERKEKNQ